MIERSTGSSELASQVPTPSYRCFAKDVCDGVGSSDWQTASNRPTICSSRACRV